MKVSELLQVIDSDSRLFIYCDSVDYLIGKIDDLSLITYFRIKDYSVMQIRQGDDYLCISIKPE